MGQPFSPNGGAPVASLATNASAVAEIIRSESALEQAAKASRPARRARCAATSRPQIVGATGPGARPTGAPLVTIRSWRAQPLKAEKAADALAAEVIDADVGRVRRHEDQGVQRPARLDPGAAEHARAARSRS